MCALTLLPIEQIDAALNSNGSSTGKAEECIGQRLLATEVVELVHGEEAARRAKIMSSKNKQRGLETGQREGGGTKDSSIFQSSGLFFS